MNQTALQRVNRRLRAVSRAHFVQYSTYMNANGFLCDAKFIGDLGLARKNLTRFLQTLNNELPAGW